MRCWSRKQRRFSCSRAVEYPQTLNNSTRLNSCLQPPLNPQRQCGLILSLPKHWPVSIIELEDSYAQSATGAFLSGDGMVGEGAQDFDDEEQGQSRVVFESIDIDNDNDNVD